MSRSRRTHDDEYEEEERPARRRRKRDDDPPRSEVRVLLWVLIGLLGAGILLGGGAFAYFVAIAPQQRAERQKVEQEQRRTYLRWQRAFLNEFESKKIEQESLDRWGKHPLEFRDLPRLPDERD
jgi:hypothetical protein